MQSSSSDISALLLRARDGDASARGELFDRFRNYLKLLTQMQLDRQIARKEDASDIVQQTFVDGLRGFEGFRGNSEGEFAAWIRTILSRNLADVVRKYQHTAGRKVGLEQYINDDLDRSSMDLGKHLVSQPPSPSENVMRAERARQLADALAEMPNHYRQVVVLRNIQGLSFGEVAVEMNRSVDSVKNLWFRAFDQLRTKLERLQ